MRYLILALFTIGLLPVSLFAQCPFKDGFAAPVRFTFPASINDFSGQKIFFTVSTSKAVYTTEMDVNSDTQFPAGFEKDYKNGRWFIFFCEDSPRVVAWVQRIRPKEIKMETKKEMDERSKKVREKQ